MKPKQKFVPFTKAHYPRGYSREDCLRTLAAERRCLTAALRRVKEARADIAQLEKELKDGGQTE